MPRKNRNVRPRNASRAAQRAAGGRKPRRLPEIPRVMKDPVDPRLTDPERSPLR